MSLRQVLEGRGGWIHRADLLDRGWAPRQVLRTRMEESIPLIRRRWLVLPDAPQPVLAAARTGTVLSCTSALEFHGLWLPTSSETGAHFAAAQTWSERPAEGRVHRASPPAPRDPRSLFDPVLNVMANIALCLPEEEAFAVWESAIRRGDVSIPQLRSIRWIHPVARTLAASVSERSDSGVESLFVHRCRRIGLRVAQQVRIAGHRVDALIGSRVVVQIDGWAFHSEAAQRRSDIRHDRVLTARGYVVLRFDYYDVVHDWPRVEQELRRVIARLAA